MKLSFVMIVKNESLNIEKCISSIQNIADECIVIDTGSTDDTQDRAKNMGASVYSIDWPDDFANARNQAIAYASGDWILMLDADEWLSPDDGPIIRDLITRPGVWAYSVTFKTLSNDSTHIEWNADSFSEFPSITGWFPMVKTVLFRNDPKIRFSGAVHESIDPALTAHKLIRHDAPITPFHSGFIAPNPQKNTYYIQLGLKKIQSEPNNPQAHFELAIHGILNEDTGFAMPLLQRALELNPSFSRARMELALILQEIGQRQTAIHLLENGRIYAPTDPHYLNHLAAAWLQNGDYEHAQTLFDEIISRYPDYINALKNRAIARLATGNLAGAAASIAQAIALAPTDPTHYILLSIIQGQMKNYSESIAAALMGHRLTPDREPTVRAVANAYYQGGNYPDALIWFSKLQSIQPDSEFASVMISEITAAISGE